MKMIFNKILCACLGHKHVKTLNDKPFTSLCSPLINEHYYVWDSVLCDRCVMYHVYKIYPAAEWEIILKARADVFFAELEKLTKNILSEIPMDDNIEDLIPTKQINKNLH
jgi:hypothetical protein